MSNGTDTAKDKALELYKLEYEQAAARYQSIYQSAWSNFSYLTAVAAGIIAFGSEGFPTYVTIMLAMLPLFFWYAAVFEPANVYGDDVIKRLSSIEDALKAKGVEMKHFSDFNARNESGAAREKSGWANWPRVRHIVRVVVALMLISLPFLYVYRAKLSKEDKPKTYAVAPSDKPLAVQVVGADAVQKLSQENEQLRRTLDDTKRSLDSISADLKEIKDRQK